MFHVFSADTADALWWDVACKFNSLNDVPMQSSRAGSTTEIMRTMLELRNPRSRWIGSRWPAINIAFALAEVVWIIRGRNDSAFLNYFNNKLPSFAGNGNSYHGAYGFRLRHSLGFDQLESAFEALRAKPDSRQVVLQIWDGDIDFPKNQGEPPSTDIPCNVVAMLKLREGRLEWTQIMRSNDFFRGFVHNIVQFTSLQEIMAGWLGVEVGSYHHFSDSLHVYADNAVEMSKATKCELPQNTDNLSLSKTQSDRSFRELESLVEVIISPERTTEQLLKCLASMEAEPSILNIARIMVCEGLRRRGCKREMDIVLRSCTNQTYSYLFDDWLNRVQFSLERRD